MVAIRGDMPTDVATREFPAAAGVLFGVGFGGFFDGIVFHQILQWHHMLSSAGYPPDSVDNLEINMVWDGLFHASTYVSVVMALVLLWRRAHGARVRWSTRQLLGTLLVGFGAFNLVEGIVDHHLLDLHHVNETVPAEQWVYWDVAFLLWGAAMLIGGCWLWRAGDRQARSADVRTSRGQSG